MEIFRKEGLTDFDDHAEKILLHARLEYEKTDENFKMAIASQEQQVAVEIRKLIEQASKECSKTEEVRPPTGAFTFKIKTPYE